MKKFGQAEKIAGMRGGEVVTKRTPERTDLILISAASEV